MASDETAKERAARMFDEWAASPAGDLPAMFERHLNEHVSSLRSQLAAAEERVKGLEAEQRRQFSEAVGLQKYLNNLKGGA